MAFYEGRAARVFKESVPAAQSRCLAFISDYDFRSTTIIAHIRKANPPEIGRAPANTHPFERELGGRSWVFAHNGKLPGIHEAWRQAPQVPQWPELGSLLRRMRDNHCAARDSDA
jgi:glutamine amidotransferase